MRMSKMTEKETASLVSPIENSLRKLNPGESIILQHVSRADLCKVKETMKKVNREYQQGENKVLLELDRVIIFVVSCKKGLHSNDSLHPD